MYYLTWADDDASARRTGVRRYFLEVTPDGEVSREIGFDDDGRVVHLSPSSVHKYGQYGLFDLTKIRASLRSDLSKEEFEKVWAAHYRK